MTRIGYLTALEQYQPQMALEQAKNAARAGFDTIWVTDHFHPWVHTGAAAGFAWAWIASAAARIDGTCFGTAVTPPLLRYHPGLIAQAFATLSQLYPGRINLGLGTGEAINELPLGYRFPEYAERNARLEEALKIIRGLWDGQTLRFRGDYYTLKNARLYTKPSQKIPIYVAASGAKSAELAGKYGDGLMTVSKLGTEPGPYLSMMMEAVKAGASKAGRDASQIDKSTLIKVSYDEDYDRALKSCRFWATTLIPWPIKTLMGDPVDIESMARLISDDAIKAYFVVSDSPEEHLNKVKELFSAGYTNIIVHSTSPDQAKMAAMYAKKVIPYLRSSS
jgi:coenzyme F420-dependent glucose-6-phosphate dehydrogenase